MTYCKPAIILFTTLSRVVDGTTQRKYLKKKMKNFCLPNCIIMWNVLLSPKMELPKGFFFKTIVTKNEYKIL